MEEEHTEKSGDLWKIYFRVLKYSAQTKGLFLLTLFFTFVGVGFKLLIPLIFSLFFNSAQKYLSGQPIEATYILTLSAIFFSVHFLDGISNAYGDYLNGKWWMTTENRIFQDIYRHITTLSMEFYEKNPTGKIRERVWDGAQAIVNILEHTFLTILPQILFILTALVILLFVKPIFGLIILVAVPVYFSITYYRFKKLKVIQEVNRKRWEQLSTFVTETIANFRTVKTYSTEDYHISKVKSLGNDAVQNEIRWMETNGWTRAYRSIILNIVRVLTIGLGFYMITKGQLLLGTFVLIWNYVTQAVDPINNMARSIDTIQKLLVGTGLTFKYLDEVPTVQDAKGSVSIKVRDAEIKFNKVSFSYKARTVVDNLTLEVPKGKVMAIVGKSGSGKTTLIRLLLRLYDPQKGEILVGGRSIKDFTQRSLRKNIAVVMQDSVLFNDTIGNNIKYSSDNRNMAKMINAAKVSRSEDFIKRLSKGYNTLVGERGVKLSGGEQQRINIARAVLKDAPILVFDEATSSLDSESEQLIQEAMWKLIEGKTTIIIAHRLSTIMKADLIVVMDKGKIAEIGTHKDLVTKKGIYSRLYEIQSGGYLK